MKLTTFDGHKFRNEVKLVETPSIIFSEQVIADMEAIVTLCKDEVTWFGVVHRDGMEFYVHEILVPPQENTKAMSDIMEHGMVVMAEELLNEEDGMERFNALRFYCHSHVNMGTGPSGQDETQTEEFGKQCGDFLIRGICNKAGRLELTLFLYHEGIVIKDVEWAVLKEEDEMTHLKQWQNFLEERVKPPPPRAVNQVGFHGGHGGNEGRFDRRRWEGQVYRNGRWESFNERSIPTNGFKAKRILQSGLTEVEYHDGRVEIFDTKTGNFLRLTYPGDRREEDEKKRRNWGRGKRTGRTQTITSTSGGLTTDSDEEQIVCYETDFAAPGRPEEDTTDNIVRDINGIPLIPNRMIHHWARPPFCVSKQTAVGCDAFTEFDEVADALMDLHMPEYDELLREKVKNLIRLYGFEIDAILEQKYYFLNERWFFDWEPLRPDADERVVERIYKYLSVEYPSTYSDAHQAPDEDEKSFIECLMAFKFACKLHIVEELLVYENLNDYFPIFKEGYLDTIELHATSGGI